MKIFKTLFCTLLLAMFASGACAQDILGGLFGGLLGGGSSVRSGWFKVRTTSSNSISMNTKDDYEGNCVEFEIEYQSIFGGEYVSSDDDESGKEEARSARGIWRFNDDFTKFKVEDITYYNAYGKRINNAYGDLMGAFFEGLTGGGSFKSVDRDEDTQAMALAAKYYKAGKLEELEQLYADIEEQESFEAEMYTLEQTDNNLIRVYFPAQDTGGIFIFFDDIISPAGANKYLKQYGLNQAPTNAVYYVQFSKDYTKCALYCVSIFDEEEEKIKELTDSKDNLQPLDALNCPIASHIKAHAESIQKNGYEDARIMLLRNRLLDGVQSLQNMFNIFNF